MRLTNRCRDLLRLLRAARWLTTSQIHRRFFPTASLAAARKRLRTLERSKYIARYRPHWMAESLLTLGTDGKRMLEKHEGLTIAMQRRPPKQLEHCLGINDLRIAAEKLPDLEYFFACWELADLNWRHRIVPDALMRIGGRTYALEFDRGQEGLRFFLKTK